MTNIDQIGERVAALINGVKSKGAWAAKHGITLRYCQYLVKDGDRKRSEKKDTNPVRVVELKAGMVVKFGKDGALYTVVAEPAIHEDQDNEHSIILKLDTYKPEPLPKKKKLSTKVIHAIHVRPSDHEVTGTFCGLDETKVQTAGLDADGYGNLSGITCKRCLRKS